MLLQNGFAYYRHAWHLFTPPTITLITVYYHYHLQTHQTKCNGIPQMLAMTCDVSAGEHAYDN